MFLPSFQRRVPRNHHPAYKFPRYCGLPAMSATDRLSNDAILGLDLDADLGLDPTTSGIVQPSAAAQASRPKKRGDKLTSDILLSGKGIPKLLDTFRRFKFAKRPKSDVLSSIHSSRSILLHSGSARYGDDHHYKNLQRILAIYQAFGHTLSPHLKFDRFIGNLARGVDDTYTKAWVRDQVREEMRAKMEKRTAIDAAADTSTSRADLLPHQEEVPAEHEDEEQWPELFGGQAKEPSPSQNGPDSYSRLEDDAAISQIKQTPMFSTFLRTSSQPIPSDEEDEDHSELAMLDAAARNGEAGMTAGEMDAFDALTAAETGLEGLLSDDEDDNDEPNADSVPVPGQFSQYLARPESSQQPQTQTQTLVTSNTPAFSDDDFSDDDDDDAALLL